MSKPEKPNRNSFISAMIVTLCLLIGLSLLLYPTVADYIHSLDYRKEITDYRREMQELDDGARQEMLEAARAWNAELTARSSHMGLLNEAQRERYHALVDPSGNGMMGYVEIEKIGVYLPVYHGTEESALHSGIGHLEGSSLPVGGGGTHTLLSGHSGLPSSKLFSNIDQLEAGDTFTLHVLGEILTYQVESSTVVLPEEAEKQELNPERDQCTLMTCTPYGVNTHRLLVRGIRIETPAPERPGAEAEEPPIPAPMPTVLWITIVGLPVAALAGIVLMVRRRGRRE